MSYLGSKAGSGAYQKIIGLMPPHDIYIEPFLGSGAVMRNKPPCKRSFGLDLNVAMLDKSDYVVPELDLICGDAFKFIAEYDYTAGEVLIYADPPYLHSTRSSKVRYDYEISEAQHIELLTLLKQVPAKIILSGYPSKLYKSMLPGWQTMEFQSMTRGGVRTEKLWFNFVPNGAYTSKYAGKNFTDRQRIKRKAERWAANYKKLSEPEKLAIFTALLETHPAG